MPPIRQKRRKINHRGKSISVVIPISFVEALDLDEVQYIVIELDKNNQRLIIKKDT